MKQLLIVNSTKAINAKADAAGAAVTPYDLSNLAEGAIAFFELGGSTLLSSVPKKNFGIALGRGTNKPAFLIPEVDIDTLEIVKALPSLGSKFSVKFTMPTPVVGKEYTIILVKKGVVTHERNLFSSSIVATSTTATAEASKLVKYINNKTNEIFNVKASVTSATITIEANDDYDYEVKFADGLNDVTPTTLVHAKPTIGDKNFIADLAQRCAADKGFNYLDQESKDIYPGYPEAVEDLVPNSGGTAGYALYSLHFATGRVAGKQTDERVWQYVHIAVPVNNPSASTINSILPEGNFNVNATSATASAAATTAATAAATAAATEVVTTMVKESALN